MAIPDQLTGQKLEENPLLPLDNQKNLVYVLTRIFRLLAQIVNPLVAWASTFKYTHFETGTWGNAFVIETKPPETGPNAALRLDASDPNGVCLLIGRRQAKTYWQVQMPDAGATQGDFRIMRFNPPDTVSHTAFVIDRVNAFHVHFGDVQIQPAPGSDRSLFSMYGGGSHVNYQYYFNGFGTMRWATVYYDSQLAMNRYNDAGAYAGTFLTVQRANGCINYPSQPKFAATNNYGVSPGTVAIFNLVAINDGGYYNGGNGRFTAPQAGIYYFDWFSLTPNTVGEYRIGLNINGVLLRVSILNKTTATFDTVHISQPIYLVAGDYVTCTLITAPAGLYADALYNTFSGWLVG